MIAALLAFLAPLRSSRPPAPAPYVSPLELHKLARKNRRRGRR